MARKTIKAKGRKLILDKNIELEISKISAVRFIEGGAAILQAAKQNHQKAKEGNKDISPLEI